MIILEELVPSHTVAIQWLLFYDTTVLNKYIPQMRTQQHQMCSYSFIQNVFKSNKLYPAVVVFF